MKEKIVQAGEPLLRQKAKPVAKKDFGSRSLASAIRIMQKALAREKYGVAIAAPQVGVPWRIFVISGRAYIKKQKDGKPLDPKDIPADTIFINPEIYRLSRAKREMSEGCLSVRGKYGMVLRHEKASIRALDARGKPFVHNASGLIAHIYQHECDHLEGILYTDKALKLQDETDTRHER